MNISEKTSKFLKLNLRTISEKFFRQRSIKNTTVLLQHMKNYSLPDQNSFI